jgi:hypothetical protein
MNKEGTQEIHINESHYPIQIISWTVITGDIVKKDQKLGLYEYLVDVNDRTETRRREIRVPFEGRISELKPVDSIVYSREYRNI